MNAIMGLAGTQIDTADTRGDANLLVSTGTDQPLDHDAFEHLKRAIGTARIIDLITLFDTETRGRLRVITEPELATRRLIEEMRTLKSAAASVCAASLSQRAASLEVRLKSGGPLTRTDLVALTEAFEIWRVAVNASWVTDAMAA